jgi:hypothetical protein
MEVAPLSTPGVDDQIDQFAVVLHQQRKKAHEFLSAQQERLRQAENNLAEQLHQIAVEMADDRRQTQQTQEDIARRAAQLQQQSELLEQTKIDLAARQAEWERHLLATAENQQASSEQIKLQQTEMQRQLELLHEQSRILKDDLLAAVNEAESRKTAAHNDEDNRENDNRQLHESMAQELQEQFRILKDDLLAAVNEADNRKDAAHNDDDNRENDCRKLHESMAQELQEQCRILKDDLLAAVNEADNRKGVARNDEDNRENDYRKLHESMAQELQEQCRILKDDLLAAVNEAAQRINDTQKDDNNGDNSYRQMHETMLQELQELRKISADLTDERRNSRLSQEDIAQRIVQVHEEYDNLKKSKIDMAAKQADWEKFYLRLTEQQQSSAEQVKQQQAEWGKYYRVVVEQQKTAAEQIKLQQGEWDKSYREAIVQQQSFLEHIKTQQTEREEYHRVAEESRQSLSEQIRQQQIEWDKLYRAAAEQQISSVEQIRQQQAELEEAFCGTVEQQKSAAEQIKLQQSELQRQLEILQDQCRILKEIPRAVAGAADGLEAAVIIETENDSENRQQHDKTILELQNVQAQNAVLQQQLIQASQTKTGNASKVSAGVLDWEAEKQRILAALENEFEEEKEEDQEEKLNIEDVVRKTDRMLSDKNREIGELRELLESQTNNIGSIAVGASALGQVLDTDALIQEERKNLAALQEEWSEKLRHAEIEISLERAKVARERSQLEEKIRIMEQKSIGQPEGVEDKDSAKKSSGRWLARLGLVDEDYEQKKK